MSLKICVMVLLLGIIVACGDGSAPAPVAPASVGTTDTSSPLVLEETGILTVNVLIRVDDCFASEPEGTLQTITNESFRLIPLIIRVARQADGRQYVHNMPNFVLKNISGKPRTIGVRSQRGFPDIAPFEDFEGDTPVSVLQYKGGNTWNLLSSRDYVMLPDEELEIRARAMTDDFMDDLRPLFGSPSFNTSPEEFRQAQEAAHTAIESIFGMFETGKKTHTIIVC